MQAAYFMCLALDKEASVRNVSDVVRHCAGKGLRWSEVAAFLQKRATVGQHPGNTPATVLEHKTGWSGNTPATPRQPTRARHKVLVSEDLPLLLTEQAETEAEAEWVTSLRAQYAALSERQTVTLGTSARIIVARYWTLEFGYVRSDETKNRRKSDSALSSLANLIEILRRNGAPFSVADLDRLARRYHREVKGGKPWYTPAAVKALLVLESAR